MTQKDEIRQLLAGVFGNAVRIEHSFSVGGGCINQTQALTLSNGERVFLKYNGSPAPGFFQAEARGLELLGSAPGGPRVPRVVALQAGGRPRYLILEYVEEGGRPADFAPRFARALAALHRTAAESYGLDHDNFIGSTPQRNERTADAIAFYREQRFRYQQELARKQGLLPASLDRQLDKLWDKLDALLDVTGEKPALVHGDLWSGNYFPTASSGAPCIFDPAVYFGLRESDLAMTELFGSLQRTFYDAYFEAFPVNPGYAERKTLFNLYHLLNHLNLFGGSYLNSVERSVDHFLR